MIHKTSVLLLIILLVACKQKIKENTKVESKPTDTTNTKIVQVDKEDYVCIPYKKVGRVLPTHTYADLEKMFGKANLKIDTIKFDGEIMGYNTLLKITPTQELSIMWKEGLPPYKTIEMIKITEAANKFKTAEGIGVGSTLTDLVKANGGQHFKFHGFGGEGAGICCSGTKVGFLSGVSSLALKLPTDDYSVFTKAEQDKILDTQKEISSNLPVWQKYMPTVDELYIYMNK